MAFRFLKLLLKLFVDLFVLSFICWYKILNLVKILLIVVFLFNYQVFKFFFHFIKTSFWMWYWKLCHYDLIFHFFNFYIGLFCLRCINLFVNFLYVFWNKFKNWSLKVTSLYFLCKKLNFLLNIVWEFCFIFSFK